MKDAHFNRNFIRFNLLRLKTNQPYSYEQFPGEVILNLDNIMHISKNSGDDIYCVHMDSSSSYLIDAEQYDKLCEML